MIPKYITDLIKKLPTEEERKKDPCPIEYYETYDILKGILWATKEELNYYETHGRAFYSKEEEDMWKSMIGLIQVRKEECQEIIKKIEEVLK